MKLLILAFSLFSFATYAAPPLAVECTADFTSPGLRVSVLHLTSSGIYIHNDKYFYSHEEVPGNLLKEFKPMYYLGLESGASYTKSGAITELTKICTKETDSDYTYILSTTQTGRFITTRGDRILNNKKVCIAYVKTHARCSTQPASSL